MSMAELNPKKLREELEFYTRLLSEHEATTKNAQLKAFRNQNSISLHQKASVKHQSHPYKFNKNQPSSSFNQKHVLHKTNFGIPNEKNKILLSKSTKINEPLQKNKNSNILPGVNSSHLKSNVLINSTSLVTVRKELQPEVKTEKSNSRLQLMEEMKFLTQLMKKTSENALQSKFSTISSNTSSINKYKTNNKDNNFQVNKILSKISSKTVPVSMYNNTKQSKFNTKLNSVPLKQFNGNKYCYKNPVSKIAHKPLRTLKNFIPKRHVEITENKTSLSEAENTDKNLHLSSKQNLTIKLTMNNNDSVLRGSKSITKSFTPTKVNESCQLTLKTGNVYKLRKISKSNSCGTRYTKVNKYSITPKPNSLRRVIISKNNKNINKKVNTMYKVVNKNKTPLNKKPLSNSKCKINRSITVDSLKELDDSAMDRLEKDLLAISTELTATPISNSVSKPCSTVKANLNSNFHKLSLKKPKSKVSKYKIVNASNLPNSHRGKKQSISCSKIGNKKMSCSKYKLINRNLKPIQISTPVKQGKSVLVKRLFKTKNTLINKNASPTSFSAKIIKSKYLTLNKRKFPLWQKNDHYIKRPVQHGKLKGCYMKATLPYQKGYFQNALLWKRTKRFQSYPNQTLGRKFKKNSSINVCKKKFKNRYACSPVVIRGVNYSINSSGKALKKLFTPRGHMTKFVYKRSTRTPENFKSPIPTTNLASRVLYRSINRIISASTKKSLSKVNTYCMFYNRFGRCNKGVKCTYIHDPSKIAVCTRFLRGTCKVDGCPFSHEIAPGKMAICSFFLVGACEKENCPYRHEELLPDAVLCKAFVQGYCPKGKECKKAHILVCPKYIHGECDKGSSCAFPHPPKKVKKNLQKDNDEEKKPDDDFLEKVARYFQAENTSCRNKLDETKVNQYVPKQRKLEEQPSFIPLCPQTSHS